MMDFEKIKQAAGSYEADMTRFLRAIVKNPGESCDEKAHVETIAAEMKQVGFDEVKIDAQGNVMGFMGNGDKIIAFDAHIDTVGIGNPDNWSFDPYEGYENETEIGGRGVSDQCGGIVSAVYGAKIMKEQQLIPEGYKIMVAGTVQEEDCDGLCWQYMINEDKIWPEFVVSTEPTDGGIYRGQRGRMAIRVDAKGVSCHGSAPERGDNAIYKMADILQDIRALNENDDADETPIKGLVKMLNPKPARHRHISVRLEAHGFHPGSSPRSHQRSCGGQATRRRSRQRHSGWGRYRKSGKPLRFRAQGNALPHNPGCILG